MSVGVKGNLSDSQGYIVALLVATASTILLTVYFLVWQTYVMRVDVIISSILLVAFGLDGLLAIGAFTQLARWEPLKFGISNGGIRGRKNIQKV